jgi:hypothetical protein
MLNRSALRLPALLATALAVSSCFSVQTRSRKATAADGGEETTGGIAVRVFFDDAARKANQPGPRGLFVELERREGKSYEPVFRSLEPAWSVLGLRPGDYRLRFTSRLDAKGDPQPLEEKPRGVKVRAGEVTEVDAVLEHVDKGLVVVGVIAAVAAAVLLHEWLDDQDLPTPPLPPIPPPAVVDAIFWISLDLATYSDEPWSPSNAARPPVVTSHFPDDGALVAARRVRVTFALSEPLIPERIDADCVELTSESYGLVEGTTTYDADRWWIVWEPADDLPREEALRATLYSECVSDLQGLALEENASFAFRTSP